MPFRVSLLLAESDDVVESLDDVALLVVEDDVVAQHAARSTARGVVAGVGRAAYRAVAPDHPGDRAHHEQQPETWVTPPIGRLRLIEDDEYFPVVDDPRHASRLGVAELRAGLVEAAEGCVHDGHTSSIHHIFSLVRRA